MQACLDELSRNPESIHDTVLVAFVKLQLIADEAHQLLISDVMDEDRAVPSYVLRKGLLVRLNAVKESASAQIQNHCKH